MLDSEYEGVHAAEGGSIQIILTSLVLEGVVHGIIPVHAVLLCQCCVL